METKDWGDIIQDVKTPLALATLSLLVLSGFLAAVVARIGQVERQQRAPLLIICVGLLFLLTAVPVALSVTSWRAAAVDILPEFAGLLKEERLTEFIGAPLEPARVSKRSLQHFSTGFMVWLEAEDSVYFVLRSDKSWFAVDEPDDDFDAAAVFGALENPSKQNFTVGAGFFRTWCRQRLEPVVGWPQYKEDLMNDAEVQIFTNGLVIKDFPRWEPSERQYNVASPRHYLILTGRCAGDWKTVDR